VALSKIEQASVPVGLQPVPQLPGHTHRVFIASQ
jgi:hypothetical protein